MGNLERAMEYMDLLVKTGRYTQRDADLYNSLRQMIDQKKMVPQAGVSPTPAPKPKPR